MYAYRFTPAQQRALDWLPADGSWRTQPGRLVAALHSLGCYYKDLIETQFGDFGPRGGRMARYRLTAKGITVKNSVANA